LIPKISWAISGGKMQNTSDEYNIDNFITLLNFIADPVIIIDEKGNFLLMNKAFEKVTGYKNEEYIGKPSLVTDKLSSENKLLLKEKIQKRISGFHVAPYEVTFLDINKGNKVFEINAKKIKFRNQPSIIVVFRDITIRKQAEQKLKDNSARMEALVNQKVREIKENDRKLRIYFDASPDAISITDANGHLLDFNNAALKLFGYSSRAEVKDLNTFTLIPAREKEKVALALEKMAKVGSFKNQRFTLLTKEGTEFPVEVSGSVVKDAYGKLIGYVNIMKDISERKKLEDALIDSEEKFRIITTAAINAIILTDDKGRIVYWNPAAEKIFGYTSKEILGQDVNQLLVPIETRHYYKQLIKKLAHDGRKYQGIRDARALRKDNTKFPIEISATSLKLKGKNFALAVIQDVSVRKKMENTLRQERDMLEKVTENIDAGLGIISKDFRILWANKLLTQAHGNNIENKLCYTIFNHLDHVCEDCGVKRIFENNEAVNRHDYNFMGKNGTPTCVELIVTPIKNKDGKIVAALELAVDVTEKRRLVKELAENSTKLEKLVEERTKQLKQIQAKLVKSERLAAIGELAAMVGHDLRNPLTGMKAATYYLKSKSKAENNPKKKEMLQMIDDCINQSNKIVDDLLEYSRTMRIDLLEINPKKLIAHSLSLIKKPNNIQISIDSKKPKNLEVDPAKINRVLLNILKNAFDAMPDGGTLSIKSLQTEKTWEITFADSGVGMSKETLEKLGNPLFTTKAKGMGFGIPICKRIVEAHGGKLFIESTLGKGTTVTIRLPTNQKSKDNGISLAINQPEK